MERLEYIEPEDADAFTRKLFKRVGMVPALYSMMANSPMAFDGFIKLNACLEGAKLDKKTREMVYLLTSQINGCDYCLASHTSSATEHGVMTVEESLDARRGESADERTASVLKLAREAVERRGKVSDEALAVAREQGLTDEELVEVVATVALATMSNYVAGLAQPDLDFKDAPELEDSPRSGEMSGSAATLPEPSETFG